MQMGSFRLGYSANRNSVARAGFCVTRFARLRGVLAVAIYTTVVVIALFSCARESL
jgi:hypothetical protein